MGTLRRVAASASFYPITALYIGSVAVVALATETWLSLSDGVVVLLLMSILAVLVSTRREVIALAVQRHELLQRIEELTVMLHAHDLPIPAPNPVVNAAQQADDTLTKETGP